MTWNGGGRRQGQPSCKRRRRRALGSLGDGVAVCRTRRVVSFGLIGRFLYVSWESGRTRLRVPRCWSSRRHDLAVLPSSPCKVSGARYRGSEEGTAFQRSYLRVQHAALVPRCVGRHQCPHPCFLPAATRSDSGSFCGSSMRARRSGRAALRVSAGNRHTRDKSILKPRAAAATPSTVAKRDNTHRRPRPSRRPPRLTAARGCRTSAARSANQNSS